MSRLQKWRDRIDREEAELNQDRSAEDQSFWEFDRSRLEMVVTERTERQNRCAVLQVSCSGSLTGIPYGYFNVQAIGELSDARIGDRLRLVFAEDELP